MKRRRIVLLAALLAAIGGAALLALDRHAADSTAPGPLEREKEGTDICLAPMQAKVAGTPTASTPPAVEAHPSKQAVVLAADSIAVTVLWHDLTPAAGLQVAAVSDAGSEPEVVVITDEAGVAVLRVPWNGPRRVVVRRGGGEPASTQPLASDADEAARRVSLFLTKTLNFHLFVTKGGKPYLPAKFRLLVGDQELSVLETQPDWGFVSTRFTPPPTSAGSSLVFEWLGSRRAVPLPPEDGNPGLAVQLELDPAKTPLAVEVVSPAEEPSLMLQRWDPDTSTWQYARQLDGWKGRAGKGVYAWKVDGLAEGRYRLIDSTTSSTSDPIDFVSEGAAGVLRLDLSRAGWVRGRIEAPPGENDTQLSLWAWHGPAANGQPNVRQPTSAGTGDFEILVSGDKPVTLQGWSPDLLPDGDAGRVTLTMPRDGVRLRMRRGPPTVLKLLQPDGSDMPPSSGLFLFAAPHGTGVITASTVTARRGILTLSCLEPGIYRLSIDDGAHGVLTLPEVVVRPEGGHLGVQRFPKGCTLRLEVVGLPAEVQGLSALVEALDRPSCPSRGTYGWDGRNSTWRMTGLEPGRHRVRFFAGSGALPKAKGIEQVVTTSPDHEAVATIDFRPEADAKDGESPR